MEVIWGNFYAGEPEYLPHSFPPTMVKPVLITSFFNTNFMADLNTGISQTVIIHILNNTPIEWYSKSQSCVKTSTYGSEYATARICTDHIVDLCNTLRYISVLLQIFNGTDSSFIFGDNFLVSNSTFMPAGKLQRRFHILNCHLTREAQEEVIIKFVHMNGNDNTADIVTKSQAYNTWFPLMKPLIFWH